MSGYGEFTTRCGRCGDSYTGTGIVGDMKAERWLEDHHEFKCRERTPEEIEAANEKMERRAEAMFAAFNRREQGP